MKKLVIIFLIISLSPGRMLAGGTAFYQVAPKPLVPTNIKSGFYLKLSALFPLGDYRTNKHIPDKSVNSVEPRYRYFDRAKPGAALDVGFLIFIGPSFANNKLRAGIDADFLSFSFNPTKPATSSYWNDPDYIPGDRKDIKYWYIYTGHRFGPVISVNPIDYLIIDVSYKMGAKIARYEDDWGWGYPDHCIGLNVRYRVMMFGVEYYSGKTNFNSFDSNNPDFIIHDRTLRVSAGFKF